MFISLMYRCLRFCSFCTGLGRFNTQVCFRDQEFGGSVGYQLMMGWSLGNSALSLDTSDELTLQCCWAIEYVQDLESVTLKRCPLAMRL